MENNNYKVNEENLNKVSGGTYSGDLIGWSYNLKLSTSVWLEVRVVEKCADGNYNCLYAHFTNLSQPFDGKPIVLSESQLRNYVVVMPNGTIY